MRKARWDSGPFLFLFKDLTFGSHFGVASARNLANIFKLFPQKNKILF